MSPTRLPGTPVQTVDDAAAFLAAVSSQGGDTDSNPVGGVRLRPRRQAVLLLGGDKSGRWSGWYVEAIPRADDLFDEYLDETGQG